jgi:hypothetical protein
MIVCDYVSDYDWALIVSNYVFDFLIGFSDWVMGFLIG